MMEEVKAALDGIRPYLQADGGDISIEIGRASCRERV